MLQEQYRYNSFRSAWEKDTFNLWYSYTNGVIQFRYIIAVKFLVSIELFY